MQMHENRYIDFLLKLIYLVLILAGIVLFFKYVFKWLIPLLVAFLLSRLIAKPVGYFHRKFRINRKFSTIFFTLATVALLGFLLYALVGRLVTEGTQMMREVPAAVDALPQRISAASASFDAFLTRYHLDSFAPKLGLDSLDGILSAIKLPDIKFTSVLSSVSWAASGLPTVLITTVFILLSTYFLCGEQDRIYGFLAEALGARHMLLVRKLKDFLINPVGKWLKAQGILICITSFELFIGFSIMHISYAGLLALLVAVIDALPILGVGTVLLPWSVLALLSGDLRRALTLCLLYGIVLLVRNSIEPRIVGAQLGLDPFVTLLCIYFGYRMAGFAGMFIVPVVVLTALKLHEWGYLNGEDKSDLPPGRS